MQRRLEINKGSLILGNSQSKMFWNGMTLDQTTQYLVEKISRYTGAFDLFECALGDNEKAYWAERHLLLSQKLLLWLTRKKGAILTCQDCGIYSHDVKVIADFKAAGTLCTHCYEERRYNWLISKEGIL